MWYIVGIIGILTALILYALCKPSGDADREMERLFKEEIKLDRKEVM